MSSIKNDLFLEAISLVESYFTRLGTFSWIWGGFTLDIYQDQILREHDDVDYLTHNLHHLIPQVTTHFDNHNWRSDLLENGDLKLTRDDIKIHLGHVEFTDKVRWTHNGEKGSIWFPREWLDPKPKIFLGSFIHVVEPEFQYVMLEHPQLLNPAWRYREKDDLALKYLRSWIKDRGISPCSLFSQISDARQEPS
ncbi:MAG TPA: hypothetical protein VGK00_09195 [Anaerolineales bacterium]|jgi:hypothetical protein